MSAAKVMVIRHAEKPAPDGSVAGVSPDGGADPEDLTVRGWQRAGALVRFFQPPDGRAPSAGIVTPDIIFASAVAKHSNSRRPQHTVLPLADLLGLSLNLDHPKGDEDALVAAALACQGTVLIAWEHEAIPAIASKILGGAAACPSRWPDDRFDLVWVFDPDASGSGWDFRQVPQMILSGDRTDAIALT